MKLVWLYIYNYILRKYSISLGRDVDSLVKHMRPHGKEGLIAYELEYYLIIN